jgi:2-isopropylmalate synthase
MTNEKVNVLDTTLRDGELSDGVRFTPADRLAIASRLADAGVDVVEVGVVGASADQVRDAQAVVARVRTTTICVLAPPDAIDAAGEALRGAASARIHVYQGVGVAGRDEAAERVQSMVKRARALAGSVEFTAINAIHGDFEGLVEIVRAGLQAGAAVISLADTAGRALPEQVGLRLAALRERVPELEAACLSFHGHDDLGLATACSLAAIRSGARQVEVAINGLGARAGNAPLEELVTALEVHGAMMGIHTDVDANQLRPLSRFVEQSSGFVVPPNKAVVGRNAKL